MKSNVKIIFICPGIFVYLRPNTAKIRKFGYHPDGIIFFVCLAINVLNTICKHQEINPQCQVVPDCLVKHSLCDWNRRSFAFHKQPWIPVSIENRYIKPFSGLIQADFRFNAYQ
jgi:hypothetical protein